MHSLPPESGEGFFAAAGFADRTVMVYKGRVALLLKQTYSMSPASPAAEQIPRYPLKRMLGRTGRGRLIKLSDNIMLLLLSQPAVSS